MPSFRSPPPPTYTLRGKFLIEDVPTHKAPSHSLLKFFINLFSSLFCFTNTTIESEPEDSLVDIPVLRVMDFPLEIIEIIIGMADKPSLLRLSLASHFFLCLARPHLFHSLAFFEAECFRLHRDNPRFDRFLNLLDCQNNTLAACVRSIHIGHEMFFYNKGIFKRRDNVHILAAKLSRITTLQFSRMTWEIIPPAVLEFLFAVPAKEVRIEFVQFADPVSFAGLLDASFMTRVNVFLHDVDVTPPTSPSLQPGPLKQNFHFTSLDATSLVNFHKVWGSDRTIEQITADTFHLWLTPRPIKNAGAVKQVHKLFPSIQTFLNCSGPRLKTLCINLTDPDTLDLCKEADLSRCITLKRINIGIIDIGVLDMVESDVLIQMSIVWKLLESLPPSSATIEEVGLIFAVADRDKALGTLPEVLQSIPWASTARRLRDTFPALCQVKFKVGAPHSVVKDPAAEKADLAHELEVVSEDVCWELEEIGVQIVFEPHVWQYRVERTVRCNTDAIDDPYAESSHSID
ncbi:hypothetical protein H0H87_010354 [Tephrocybe sp. NHM501043]|nr:hypothetical protein H0H87_010354 [Tephrocybe sp. NHM501043]